MRNEYFDGYKFSSRLLKSVQNNSIFGKRSKLVNLSSFRGIMIK
jgi:hypothetical protein